ncbi:hypothetical protein GMDG_02218 [Pseudogymnoascus destructans 20631-21]|uniref:Opioid growth factor receptor (OGFr) conserved domain-containing protein n=1 Tax=Pseudogymnoascus destructans (strain ATCC MYA-4855 / 20631-21) TaxID=658429 RepID=L8G0I1_PSED2|nr:hypothetical protein GMDG_02218 [Pseudogymnoascus destructans 20631-21]
MPPKKPKPFSIVSWYGGNMVTPKNVSIQNVLHYSDDDLERRHDFIQLLFPLPWASQHANRDVVATKGQLATIRGGGKVGKKVRMTMLEALKKILAMFDLELTPVSLCKPYGDADRATARHRNRGRRIRRITPVEAGSDDEDAKKIDHAAREARFQALANPGNHHHRRITRIIRSLRLAGRPEDAESVYRFFRRFAGDHPTIPRRTLHMWSVAANSPYLFTDPAEDYKTTSQDVKDGEPSDEEEEKESSIDEGGGNTTDEGGSVEDGGGGGVEGGGGDGVEGEGDDGSSGSGSTSSSEKAHSVYGTDDGFGSGDGTPPPPGPNEGQPPKIGDPRMSDEEVQKLTPLERDLHHARIQHRKENREIEIKLNYRNANGEWIAVDKDPMTITLIDLRIWQIVLRDKEEERRGEEAIERRIKEGRDLYESSSDSSEEDDENDGKEFLRTDIRRFGKRDMSPEDRAKLEPWELKLHLAQIEHLNDYLEIEVKFRFRDGDGFWRGQGAEPIMMNLWDLRAWQIEMDHRQAQWMDEVTRGDRRWSAEISSKSSQESDFDIGDPRMSERCFAQLGAEDQERHLALRTYIEKFRQLEYELGFRDRTTFEWIAVHMDPNDMNLEELELWDVEMEQMENAFMAKQDAEEATEEAAAEAAAAANGTTTQPAQQRRQRVRSPEGIEDEEIMADRVRRGLDPFGDFPEAIVYKAMYLQREKEWEEKEEKRLEAERLEKEKQKESDDPGEQLRVEEAARARAAKSMKRTSREKSTSSRSKRRRVR